MLRSRPSGAAALLLCSLAVHADSNLLQMADPAGSFGGGAYYSTRGGIAEVEAIVPGLYKLLLPGDYGDTNANTGAIVERLGVVHFSPQIVNAARPANCQPFRRTYEQRSVFGQQLEGESLVIACRDAAGRELQAPFRIAIGNETSAAKGWFARLETSDPGRTGTYSPPAQYNSRSMRPGQRTMTVEKLPGSGQYRVSVPLGIRAGLPGEYGAVMVSAVGGGEAYCGPGVFGPTAPGDVPAGQIIEVRCYNTAGVLADARFSLSFMVHENLVGDPSLGTAYALVDFRNADSYTAPALSSYNSSGAPRPISGVRNAAAGRYRVRLPGFFDNQQGHAFVVAVATNRRCGVEATGDEVLSAPGGQPFTQAYADIACFDTRGKLANAQFQLHYLHP